MKTHEWQGRLQQLEERPCNKNYILLDIWFWNNKNVASIEASEQNTMTIIKKESKFGVVRLESKNHRQRNTTTMNHVKRGNPLLVVSATIMNIISMSELRDYIINQFSESQPRSPAESPKCEGYF